MLTDDGFKRAYSFLMSEFRDDDISDMQLLTHKTMLIEDGVTDAELMGAVKTLIRDRKYAKFPRYAEILEAVRGNPEDKAILALKTVEDAMQEHGAYKSVSFEDKIALTCIENLGGWVAVCQMELKDWEWKKKEFISLYKALMRNPQNIKKTPYLVGLCEHQNRRSGYEEIADETKVVMIGYAGTKQVPLLEVKKDEPQNRVLSLAQGLVKGMGA